MSDKPEALLQRMQEAAQGHEEWRVQNPETGSYCIAYSRNDGYSLGDPERAARKWLADHQAQFPGSTNARYVVACVKVQTHHQRLLDEAAAELRLLHAFGEKVNAIRNSIIGCQKINWSEHIYPLVAALDEAGFVGLDYDTARANVGTLIERANKAECECERMAAALTETGARVNALADAEKRLLAECERLRADAERYRFLRQHYVSSYWARGSLEDLDREIDEASTVPAAIDAASKGQA